MKLRSFHLVYLCLLPLVLGGMAHAAPAQPRSEQVEDAATQVSVRAQISNAMGGLTWGISKKELQKKLADDVENRYRARLAMARDASEREPLRRAADDEIGRIQASYVEFKSASTEWDASFLRGEFTFGNNESMLVSRDQTSRSFYFFVADKLWKLYTVFEPLVFPEGEFGAFASALQGRFGRAREAHGELSPGHHRRWIEWQAGRTRLRAIDQSNSYGFHCLIFEDMGTASRRAKLRSKTRVAATKR